MSVFFNQLRDYLQISTFLPCLKVPTGVIYQTNMVQVYDKDSWTNLTILWVSWWRNDSGWLMTCVNVISWNVPSINLEPKLNFMTWTLSLLTDLNSNTPHSLQNISYCYICKSLVFNPMIGSSWFFFHSCHFLAWWCIIMTGRNLFLISLRSDRVKALYSTWNICKIYYFSFYYHICKNFRVYWVIAIVALSGKN